MLILIAYMAKKTMYSKGHAGTSPPKNDLILYIYDL